MENNIFVNLHGMTFNSYTRRMNPNMDYMHWSWTNFPNSRREQCMWGYHEHPEIMLEAVTSHDMWI